MAKPGRGRPATPSGSGSGSSRSPSRSRSRSTGSDSRSSSRSRSHSRSVSSSSVSRSASSRSRSPPPQRKSPVEGAKRGRSPPPQSKKISPPPRKPSPVLQSLELHVDQLSRNVNEAHLREIFSNFGDVVKVRLAMDSAVNLSKGYGYVEFKMRADAEKAQIYMDGAQIDGNVVRAKFTLPERKKVSPPPKVVAAASKKDGPKIDAVGADVEKGGPKRPRECMSLLLPLASLNPPCEGDLLSHEEVDLPDEIRTLLLFVVVWTLLFVVAENLLTAEVKHLLGGGLHLQCEVVHLPLHQEGTDHQRGPRPGGYVAVLCVEDLLFHQGAGNTGFQFSPPRRARSPPRRSPINRRRSRSPIRRPVRSGSRSVSPRRGRAPVGRRGRSSSYSGSPSPRRVARRISRSPRRYSLISRNGEDAEIYNDIHLECVNCDVSRVILCILRFDILFGDCYTGETSCLTSKICDQLAVSQHLLFPRLYRPLRGRSSSKSSSSSSPPRKP
ncbi:hypothetical protein RHSIM_Rhsim06G0238800 [Rhododendron simsii]|uniref:RRM domain-containing protein n=1 Tax=Rhododendron simsii TaxID=118357 RepID=A0A834LKF1_RHOSS|nr:hypothetical protein RHSIM_Rhsim06G0238800 [Rhododendron simsii]